MATSKVPPLLEPLLGRLPPEAALVVVTSVLGASANWLVLRWLHALLRRGDDDDNDDETAAVVLVSFMRDGAFWRDGAARIGLDLDAQVAAGRCVIVDGLSGLFAQAGSRAAASGADVVLGGGGKLDEVRRGIDEALGRVGGGAAKTVLVLDQVDALLATAAGATSLAVQNMIVSLRERAHATMATLSADAPLLQQGPTTALEREHAALVLSQAHAARAVVSLRLLDTGAARDVSGVVRVAMRAADGDDDDDGGGGDDDADAEYLYHVAGDGAVAVFERGA